SCHAASHALTTNQPSPLGTAPAPVCSSLASGITPCNLPVIPAVGRERAQGVHRQPRAPLEGDGGVPGEPVERPAAVRLLPGGELVQLALDRVLVEEPAAGVVGPRADEERGHLLPLRAASDRE